MRFRPKYAPRPDGTFVIALDVPGRGVLDYHVTADDPLFPAVAQAYVGLTLPREPRPAAVVERRIAPVEFLRRFTKAERRALRVAARRAGGDDIDDWMDLVRVAWLVDLDDAFITDGIAALVAANVLTAPRAAEILG